MIRTIIQDHSSLRLRDLDIRERLGRSTNGTVSKALHMPSNIVVAIKTANAHPNAIMSLENEIQIMKRLRHPNISRIIVVYDLWNENPCYAMDVAENGSLFTFLGQNTLTIPQENKILYELAGVLAYLHERRIVHGDVSPNNILLRNNLNIILSDFGRAEDLNSPGPRRSGEGTPGFRSKNQKEGHPIGPLDDTFSFGITIYIVINRSLRFNQNEAEERLHGSPPQRPTWDPRVFRLWGPIMERSYDDLPLNRPTMAKVLSILNDYISRGELPLS